MKHVAGNERDDPVAAGVQAEHLGRTPPPGPTRQHHLPQDTRRQVRCRRTIFLKRWRRPGGLYYEIFELKLT